jgi:hypothetical protein
MPIDWYEPETMTVAEKEEYGVEAIRMDRLAARTFGRQGIS